MEEYHKGFPVKTGWYECLVEGEKVPLKHYYCCMREEHRWIATDGSIVREEVLWKGSAQLEP